MYAFFLEDAKEKKPEKTKKTKNVKNKAKKNRKKEDKKSNISQKSSATTSEPALNSTEQGMIKRLLQCEIIVNIIFIQF